MDSNNNRPSGMDSQGPPKKKSKPDDSIYDFLIPVNPIEALKFCVPDLVYKTTNTVHDSCDSPVFTVVADYNKKQFKGMHPDFSQAKLKTAQKILDAYIKDIFTKSAAQAGDLTGKIHTVPKKGVDPLVCIVGRQTISTFKKQKESPIYVFFQLHLSSIRFKKVIGGNNKKDKIPWTAIMNLAGKEYVGISKKKKRAHKEVLRAALLSFTAEDMNHLAKLRDDKLKGAKRDASFKSGSSAVEIITIDDDEESVNKEKVSSTTPNEKLIQDNNNNESDVEVILCDSTSDGRPVIQESTSDDSDGFGDFVSRLVESSFQILKEADPSIPDYKVLAGIVMSSGIAINGSKVVSLATGTRSITGSHLSLDGEVVNDCHAEILARRGLVSFFYDQIEKYASNPEESILEPAGTNDQFRLKVKEEIRFHLYISSAPCGDASLNSLSDTPSSYLHGGGALRAKREKNEGTVPIIWAQIQSWNDIILGESLFTMSCSDKIARWNVLGLQGSLLSHLMRPIYFHTIVIGDRFHSANLSRALIHRVSNLQGIPAQFVVAQPILVPGTTSISITSGPLFHEILKNCVSWVDGWRNPEVIECTKGKLKDGSSSRLCKRSFLQRFLSVAQRVPGWNNLIEPLVKDGEVSYADLKKASRQFGEAKDMINTSFEEAGYGKWVKKPVEQDIFECPFGKIVKG